MPLKASLEEMKDSLCLLRILGIIIHEGLQPGIQGIRNTDSNPLFTRHNIQYSLTLYKILLWEKKNRGERRISGLYAHVIPGETFRVAADGCTHRDIDIIMVP